MYNTIMKQALASQGKFHAKEKRNEFKKILDKRASLGYNELIKNGVGN